MAKMKSKKPTVKREKLPMTPMPEGSTLTVTLLPDGTATAKMKSPNPGGEDRYGARASQAKVCAFCKHEYLKPCTDKTKATCQNFIHLQGSKKK